MTRISIILCALTVILCKPAQGSEILNDLNKKPVRVLCLSSGLINPDIPDPTLDDVKKHTLKTWVEFFGASTENPKNIMFIPDAQVVEKSELDAIDANGWPESWTDLMKNINKATGKFGLNLVPYSYEEPTSSLTTMDGVFVWGGNTFFLQDRLYRTSLFDAIHKAVLENGLPYLGGSAGTNVATKTICTTNDMCIIQPFDWNGMGLLPFAVNVHYISEPMHYKNKKGDFIPAGIETRDARISEFLIANPTCPYVVLMPNTTAIERHGDTLNILGAKTLDVASFENNKYIKTPFTSSELTQLCFKKLLSE